MTCNRLTIMCLCFMFWSICCHADSLIITYNSGKTQTIPLDDSIQAINTLKYLTNEGTVKNTAGVLENKTSQDASVAIKPDPKPDVKDSPASQGKIKFRWASPIVGE